jgi:superfamily I DNA and RNA helicase
MVFAYDCRTQVHNDSKNAISYISVKHDPNPGSRASQYLEMLSTLEINDSNLFQSCLYDAVFVDEGQDLVPEEYKLLNKLVKLDKATGGKNLMIFYDDAQNLYARPRPKWKDLGIEIQNRSRVMKQCHRNTCEVLDLAFNILMGKQASHQHQVHMREFADVNLLKQNKLVEETESCFRIKFSERSFEKPLVKAFQSRCNEKEWLASEVIKLIYEQEVRPEDMLIVFDRESDFRDLSDIIRKKDLRGMIGGFVKPYGSNDQDKDNYIFKEKHITISTTKGAKGYDAHIVFLVGADLFKTDEEGRASFYVGSTRSKLVLCVTGVQASENLLSESLRLSSML